MANQKDILTGTDGELLIRNGDFAVGFSELDEVARILELSQGELKSDPILGPGLNRFMKGVKVSVTKIQQLIRKHLTRDGKDYDEIKKLMTTKIDKQ